MTIPWDNKRLHWLYALLLSIFILDMLDGAFTLRLIGIYGDSIEANPLLQFMTQTNPVMLPIVKLLTFIIFFAAIMLGVRKQSYIIYPALYIVLAAYSLINIYHGLGPLL